MFAVMETNFEDHVSFTTQTINRITVFRVWNQCLSMCILTWPLAQYMAK